ncbi:MAG: hypothetical protein VW270_14795 [Candidatus Poseidoniales archaeon]
MSRFEEANETIEKYGFEEAVFILADRWGQSTYTVEKYLASVEDMFTSIDLDWLDDEL